MCYICNSYTVILVTLYSHYSPTIELLLLLLLFYNNLLSLGIG